MVLLIYFQINVTVFVISISIVQKVDPDGNNEKQPRLVTNFANAFAYHFCCCCC